MKIHYYGHAGVKIEDDLIILIDPWLNDNPLVAMKADEVMKADYIIATHNHFDHVNDIPLIAKNTGATVVSILETADDLASKGCKKTIGCNIGGTVKLEDLELIFTQAFHSMSSNPSGVVIFYNDKKIYHAGDTGVFGDMKLIGEMYPLDLAFLPVGGHFTMGIKEAKKAVQLLNAKKIVPIHYNTFDVIEQEVDESLVKESDSQLLILKPGEEFTLL
jgi:L-ascorbate metabolism protein UlaG (beta-lactamase superfamily)|tara:strand:+ start:952 stop:1605 length:654 start_codon:yes stop_codon:yes gene_type:complete